MALHCSMAAFACVHFDRCQKCQTLLCNTGHRRRRWACTYQNLPEISGALAHSERPFYLPTWAQLLTAAPRTYSRDVQIFGQQEPAEYLYKVVSGAVRTLSLLRDGRRHVAAFYLAGDFFGYDGNNIHTLSAEAVCDAKILVIKRSVLAVLAEHDKDIADRLKDITSGELARAQARVTLLIKTSSERIADFLLEMG